MQITYDKSGPIFADLSHYRLIRNESAFVAASTAGIIAFKVNEDSLNDRTMQRNVDVATRNKLIQVGYEYDHGTDGDASDFLNRFPPAPDPAIKRVACIDCEAADLSLAGVEKWIQAVQAAYGSLPWVYGRNWFVNQGAQRIASSIVAQCPYWASQYSPRLYVPAGLKIENTIAWQFTNGVSGPMAAPRKFPGIGPCDISLLLLPLNV